MTETTISAQVREVMAILERAMCLNPVHLLLPPDIERVREHLDKSHLDVDTKFSNRLAFFYRICAILLQQPEPITMGHFSEFVGMPLSSATRVVDWLVNAGYVERLPDPEDRRIVLVSLTNEGRTVYRAMNTNVKQRMEQILHRFSMQERKTLIMILRKVVDVLRDLSQ